MMRELQMVFHKDGRRWEFPGVGSVRATNWRGREMIAAAPGREEWRFKGGTVTDPTGAEVLSHSGGLVTYRGRELSVKEGRAKLFGRREPIVLLEGERELARFEPKMWIRDRAHFFTIVDDDFAREEPLLLLYAAYCAHGIAARAYVSAAGDGIAT
jgi:hypothetical protein